MGPRDEADQARAARIDRGAAAFLLVGMTPFRSIRRALLGVALATGGLRSAAAEAPLALGTEIGLPLQRYFSSDDYDGFSRVTAVAHTAEGFAVFGTYHAAILYDGVTHEKIAVPATYVTALCVDEAGTTWAGGDNEIGVIAADPADGQLRYASRTRWLPETRRTFGRLRALVAGRAGVFAATSNGVLRFADGRAEWMPRFAEGRSQLFSLGGRIFLHDSLHGLHVFDGSGFQPVATTPALAGREIQIAERTAAHALCVVEGDGLFDFVPATGRLEKIPSALDALVAEPLLTVLPLRDGRIVFVRGNNRGIVIADPALQGAQVLDAKTGLANCTILNAALDAEDGLWLGLANGLLRLDLAPGVSVFDERNALPIGSVGSLVRHDGALYAASTQGLMRLQPGQPATGAPARFVPDARVPEICDNLRDTPEGLLFSTNDTVELLSPAGRSRLFDPQAKITMIKANRRAPGLYFIATDDGGVHVLDLPARRARSVLTLPAGVILWNGSDESELVSWFGTAASGFWRIASPSREWTEATAEPHPLGAAGLPEGKSWTGVFPLFDELHFLTESGMYRWQPARRTFDLDPRFRVEGASPLRFMPAVADSDGRAWTSPWSGTVACAKPLGFFEPDGANAFAWRDAPARWQAAVGRFGAGLIIVESESARPVLWTKSPTAIARIELDTLQARRNGAGWRPHLRRFSVGEHPWPVSGGATVRLPFSNEPITLRYAAPSYQPGAPVRYQTRLRGFREAWSAPTVSPETAFTNLTGGPFVFEVRAIDADGVVSEAARLKFSVAPPWHRSPWAYAAYGAMALGAVFGFVRWRLHHADRERARLERLVVQRTAELAAAKEQADSASAAKSAFLASMSHELRTPLNGIIGYAQVLMKDRDLTEKNRDRLRVVQTSGEHLLRLINEVLDLSKIEAGRMELHPAPFHLPQLLRDIAAAISTRAEQKELEFVFDAAPDLPEMVVGDAQKLRQIIDNLLSNAIKFTARGEVRLTARPLAPDGVSFSVRDTGPGIGEADRARIFQPFQQAADARATEPGTGLGLAISQRFAALMGSQLALETQLGAGSCFSFAVRLPALAIDTTDPTGAPRTVTGYTGPRRTLLIVDDIPVNRHVLRDLLRPLGFGILEAASGETALQMSLPDLAFLDLRMPGMGGLELARRIRAQPGGDQIKLIAMSASVLVFSKADALAAGCDDFLPKPFREAELLEKLAGALGLEWTFAEPAAPRRDSRQPFADARSDLAPAMLEELLSCARRGEIRALRTRLSALRTQRAEPDGLLDTLDALARSYRMEQIRALLERQLTAPPAPPP